MADQLRVDACAAHAAAPHAAQPECPRSQCGKVQPWLATIANFWAAWFPSFEEVQPVRRKPTPLQRLRGLALAVGSWAPLLLLRRGSVRVRAVQRQPRTCAPSAVRPPPVADCRRTLVDGASVLRTATMPRACPTPHGGTRSFGLERANQSCAPPSLPWSASTCRRSRAWLAAPARHKSVSVRSIAPPCGCGCAGWINALPSANTSPRGKH